MRTGKRLPQRIDGGRSIASSEREKRALLAAMPARETAPSAPSPTAEPTYKDTVSIVHQGHAIVLSSRSCAEGKWKIGYTVLLPDEEADGAGAWTHFTELTFPTELRPVGMTVISLDFGDEGVPVADVPFWALSDGSHVYVFRQSAKNTLLVDRFVYDDLLNALVNTWEVRYRRSKKIDIPADRKDTFGSTDMEGDTFIEATTELTPVGVDKGWFTVVLTPAALPGSERWQIFAHDATSLAMNCFSFARTSGGLFDLTDANKTAVEKKPTVIPDCGIKLKDATFNGPPCALVYSKQERLKDESGRYHLMKKEARVMLAVPTPLHSNFMAVVDFGIGLDGRLPRIAGVGAPPQVTLDVPLVPTIESALHFERFGATAATIPPLTAFPSGTFSVELWLAPQPFSQGTDIVLQSGTGEAVPFAITLQGGVPTFTVFGKKTVAGPKLEPGFWTHLACTWDGTTATIFVNGSAFTATGTEAPAASFAAGYSLGGADGFSGDLCELRFWKRRLSRAQVLSRMCATITPSDSGWANLVGYWRFEQPKDDTRWPTFANSSSAGAAANGTLNGATWVASQAPTERSFAPVAWSADGLTVCTGLLGQFAGSKLRPSLMESSDARVHLYFCSTSDSKQMAAHYSTITSRATFAAKWKAGPDNAQQAGVLRFASRYTGSAMNSSGLAPVKIEKGDDDAHAVVRLRSYTGYRETWPAVPRDLASFCAVINGNAIQAGEHPKPGVVEYDYRQVSVIEAGGQHGPPPGPRVGSSLFAVAPDGDSTNGHTALVQNTDSPPPMARIGIDNGWMNDPPAAALQLKQPGSWVSVLDEASIGKYKGPLSLARGMCVEAWLNPTPPLAESAILLFNEGSQGSQYRFGLTKDGKVYAGNKLKASTSKSAIPASAWTHVAASYHSDFGVTLSGQRYLDAGNDDTLNTGDAVTIEGWVNLSSNNVRQTIASKADEGDVQWELYVDSDGKPAFDVTTKDGTAKKLATVKSPTKLDTGKWHHVAGVYDVASENVGAVRLSKGDKDDNLQSVNILVLPGYPKERLTVSMWVNLQSESPIQGLMCGGGGANEEYNGWSLYLHNRRVVLRFKEGFAVSGAGFELPLGKWTHVCGTVDGTHIKVYVDGIQSGIGDTKGTHELDLKYYFIGRSPGTYRDPLYGLVKDVSLWNYAQDIVEVRNYIRTRLTGVEKGLMGCWPLANTGINNVAIDIAKGVDGSLVHGAHFVKVDKGQFIHRLLVDGTPVAERTVTSAPAQTEDRMQLGSGALASYFQGTIDAVRLWNVGRMIWELQYYAKNDLGSDGSGLVSDWEFETGSGHVGSDSKSQNDAVLRDAKVKLTDAAADAMWVPTDIRAGWRIYVNGVEADTDPMSPQSFGASQCSIGGMLDNNVPAACYPGSINELRVWKNQRTGRQLRENMNRPLSGVEDGLVGYWPFSAGSGKIFPDQTGFGANGAWKGVPDPTWQTSLAPVSDEAPHILDAVGGVAKPTNLTSESTPVAAEYGELFADATGALDGLMARAYGAVSGGALKLVQDYGVGELLVQYVGQVQTKPSLIGYIEGAPPLPSENLTVDSPITPYKYLAASTVALTESDDITYAYTASREVGTTFSSEGKIGAHMGFSITAGFLTFIGVDFEVGYKRTVDTNMAWSNDAVLSTESRAATEKTIEVFGAWVKRPDAYKFDPQVKRLYVPNNKGFALVRSATADLYALRSIATGALVQYSMRPNPDIPPDTNIIMFKIDPKYVKNGTLDGYVGFDKDVDYGSLAKGERGSYFKPLEAYALKALIAREQHQLKAYYDQFDAPAVGQGGDIRDESRNLGNLLLNLPGNDAISRDEWKAQIARRSLVNTYVWNSDGGLYSEEEQFGAVREESESGTYEYVARNGLYSELGTLNGPTFSLEFMFGSRLVTKAMKSRRDATSFGIHVNMPGEGFLNKRTAALPQGFPEPGQYPVAYDPDACPGKVNQYRFMSFYLAPRKKNFDDFRKIVDEAWLDRTKAYAGSYDPDAFALKQALANPNLAWRVLHRVTYVNRVPLDPTHRDAETLSPDIHKPDAQSVAMNRLLIEAVPVPVNDQTPLATISKDLDKLLSEMSKNTLYGKLVAANIAEIKSDAMYFMQGYHELV
jgi:hypothetical protein